MTRLTEALERARATGVPVEPPVTAATVVPSEWQFDATQAFDHTPAAPEQAEPPLVPQPAPPVGVVPEVESPGGPAAGQAAMTLIGVGQGDTLLVEQYRRLAAVLHHAQAQRGTHTLMVASAVPAEGKTLTTTNLALTLSQSYQKRVLLIDADLRRPNLHNLFKVPNTSGLSTSLLDVELARLPVRQVAPGLWLLPAGRPQSNPMSLLTSEAMKELLRAAAAEFDWVLVDTPPVGLMPDANLLAAMVDAALVVVYAGQTPYPLVKKAVEAIGLERVLGIVLNRAERSAAAGAYSYNYYNYYEDESRKAPRGLKRLVLG